MADVVVAFGKFNRFEESTRRNETQPPRVLPLDTRTKISQGLAVLLQQRRALLDLSQESKISYVRELTENALDIASLLDFAYGNGDVPPDTCEDVRRTIDSQLVARATAHGVLYLTEGLKDAIAEETEKHTADFTKHFVTPTARAKTLHDLDIAYTKTQHVFPREPMVSLADGRLAHTPLKADARALPSFDWLCAIHNADTGLPLPYALADDPRAGFKKFEPYMASHLGMARVLNRHEMNPNMALMPDTIAPALGLAYRMDAMQDRAGSVRTVLDLLKQQKAPTNPQQNSAKSLFAVDTSKYISLPEALALKDADMLAQRLNHRPTENSGAKVFELKPRC